VDGHIDDGERVTIDQEIERLGGEADLRAWVEAELQSALDPQGIADEVAGDARLALSGSLPLYGGHALGGDVDQLCDSPRIGGPGEAKRRIEGHGRTGEDT